jgi:hypothetical protein
MAKGVEKAMDKRNTKGPENSEAHRERFKWISEKKSHGKKRHHGTVFSAIRHSLVV